MRPAVPVVVDGVRYVRLADLCSYLPAEAEVTDAMLRMWVRRRGLRRARMDGSVWYDLDGALEIERDTRESGRGRPRGSGAT
ncbi:MAG TPA: hypothetical protein VFM54_24420 [Micromonosporaceae bacterium]|nr:hypothetical protein [Micromonosporaceae bacterium]